MKIDVSQILTPSDTRADVIKRKLFWHLYSLVYERDQFLKLGISVIDLEHMARELRLMGWHVYYWRDPVDRCDSFYSYGPSEGLVFGIYCSNLTQWMLAHS